MPNRFENAIKICDGGVHASEIAKAMVAACSEIKEAGGGDDVVNFDPAVRLMMFQLGWLGCAQPLPRDNADMMSLLAQCYLGRTNAIAADDSADVDAAENARIDAIVREALGNPDAVSYSQMLSLSRRTAMTLLDMESYKTKSGVLRERDMSDDDAMSLIHDFVKEAREITGEKPINLVVDEVETFEPSASPAP